MKKKILVFFMVFILLFVFTVNIFGATQLSQGSDGLYWYNYLDVDLKVGYGYIGNNTMTSNSQGSFWSVWSNPIYISNFPSSIVYFSLTNLYLVSISSSNNTLVLIDTIDDLNYYSVIGGYIIIRFQSPYASGNNSYITFSYNNLIPVPFYQPFIDFNSQLIQNTWSFIPDLFGDTYLNFTIFIAGIFSILFMIFVITYMIKKITRGI